MHTLAAEGSEPDSPVFGPALITLLCCCERLVRDAQCLFHQGESASQVASSLVLVVLSPYFFFSFYEYGVVVWLLLPSRCRRSTEAPSKHAQRETSSRGQGGNRARDLSPETHAAGPRNTTLTVPGAAKKAKESSLCELARSKRTSTASKSKKLR